MQANHTGILATSAHRLFPGLSLDQAIAQLLLEHAQRNLIKYQAMARTFEAKYRQDFQAFRRTVLASEPTFEVEQDYFDWELAVTEISDMAQEIQRLKTLAEHNEHQ